MEQEDKLCSPGENNAANMSASCYWSVEMMANSKLDDVGPWNCVLIVVFGEPNSYWLICSVARLAH